MPVDEKSEIAIENDVVAVVISVFFATAFIAVSLVAIKNAVVAALVFAEAIFFVVIAITVVALIDSFDNFVRGFINVRRYRLVLIFPFEPLPNKSNPPKPITLDTAPPLADRGPTEPKVSRVDECYLDLAFKFKSPLANHKHRITLLTSRPDFTIGLNPRHPDVMMTVS